MTDTYGPAKQVLLTPIATIRSKFYDDTCILQPGCHEFITSLSYVFYRGTCVIDEAQITQCLGTGEYISKADVDENLYYRIALGIHNSEQCPQFAGQVLTEYDLPDVTLLPPDDE